MQLKTYPIPCTFLLLLVHTCLFGQNKIIWGESPGKILMANLDGSDIQNILQKNAPFDLAADSIGKRIYWTDNANNAIFSTGLDDKEVVKVYQASAYLQGLTIDKNQIYFIMGNTITKFDLATKKVETVVSSLVNALDVVIIEKQVYWSESGIIKRLSLDGKNIEVMVANFKLISNLIFNAVDQKLYFSGGGRIYKVNPDGSQLEYIVSGNFFSLDKTGRKLLLPYGHTPHSSSGGVIKSINTDGSNLQDVWDTTLNPGLVINLEDKIFWSDRNNGYNSVDYLFSAKKPFGLEVRASSQISNPTHLVIDPLEKYVYWVENGATIKRSTFTGDVQSIYTIPTTQRLVSIALDHKNKKFYWTDNNTSTPGIYRMNLDGTNVENLSPSTFYPNPIGLFIHPNQNQLYWTDYTARKIVHAELNGKNAEVIDLPLFLPGSLALSNAGEFFFTGKSAAPSQTGFNYIFKMPASGGMVENIYLFQDAPMSFCIDAQNGYLYWTDSKKIMQADLQGKNVKSILDFRNGPPERSLGPIQIYHPEYKIVIREALLTAPLKISPNPFHAFLRIEDLEEGDLVQVYNMMGQIYNSQKVEQGGSITILGQNLPVGMAYLYIRSKNGKVSAMKIYKY